MNDIYAFMKTGGGRKINEVTLQNSVINYSKSKRRLKEQQGYPKGPLERLGKKQKIRNKALQFNLWQRTQWSKGSDRN
jgi:hypothetical protein